MAGVASTTAGHPSLVDGAQGHTRDKRPAEVHSENQGILLHCQNQDEGFPGARIYCTPSPKSLNRNAFLPDELSCQDMWPQLTLLTITYTRSLQYWAEKLSLPRSPDLSPLAESVKELWEMVWEYVTFSHWDDVQGLGTNYLRSPSQQPGTTIFSCMLSTLV